ncbi:MAG: CRTAC1 family protein [Planctomycetia bacterium]
MASGPTSLSDIRPTATLVVLAVVLTACGRSRTDPQPFVALSAATTGITFVNDVSGRRDYPLPEITGSGCAIADLDADGRPDVAAVGLLGTAAGGRLEIFWQRDDGRFDGGPLPPLPLSSAGKGVAIGDLTNDGLPEILVTCEREDHLFHNLGGRRFEDVTSASGYDNPAWGTGACFVDVDRDGWLDIFVVNYVGYEDRPCGRGGGGPRDYCPPHLFAPTIDRLFRNTTGTAGGDAGPRLVDRTAAAGLAAARGPGLGCTAADLTGDGWPDLYVANDQAQNRLWVNQRDGTFRDEAVLRGCAVDALGRPQAGMGVVVEDFDDDGHWDLFLTHLEGEYHTLYRGLGRGLFEDATAAAGLVGPTRPFTGFGVAAFDVEHDGDADLVCVAGRVQRDPDAAAEPHWSAYRQRGLLLWNEAGRFHEERSTTGPLSVPAVARGLAAGDLDADGDLDIVVNRTGEPLLTLANVAASGHSIRVRPTLPECGGREAIGAVVTVVTPSRSFRRILQPGMGYLSSHEPCVHVGLADETVVERIDVAWPDGSLSSHAAGPVDRVYTIAGPDSGAAVPLAVGKSPP